MFDQRERVVSVHIEDEMKKSYIDYAMSVIVGRALPEVRDGLKPVHRRIIYDMYLQGMMSNKPYKKCAAIVGDTIKLFHPHGEMAIYDALVRFAQDFACRYPLIDGQGNFGSIDGDPPAAYRYTEARLSAIAEEMLVDIDKDTVNFVPNFDESTTEPTVLPCRIPNLLINGSSGIAVGMATNIPPHNLNEVVDALILLIDKPEASLEEIMQVLPGPDFPTGAQILGREGIIEAYRTGKGKIVIRAQAMIETLKGGKTQIVVNEIPYQVNKANLIESIASLVREKKIEGISDLRDESDREGMRIVIELKKDAIPQVVLNQLYKHTQLQDSFGIINLALVDGSPRYLSLPKMLLLFIEHRKEVVTRRTKFELRKAQDRAHILEGLKIALDHLDAVINLIRASKTPEEARDGLMTKFGLTETQALAILAMRLQQLTGLERQKIDDEYRELIKTIEYLNSILRNPKMVLDIIKKELREVKEKHGDKRRTQIVDAEGDFEMEDLIAEENMVVTITHGGYIKRISPSTYHTQRRGGVGVTGMETKEEDFVEQLFIASTHDYILFFTDKGKVHWLKVYEIPQGGRAAKGKAIVNLLEISPEEKITAGIPVREFDSEHYIVMVTEQGIIKKTELAAFSNPRKGGIIAVSLEPGDKLVEAKLTNGHQQILIGTKQGKAIRFPETDVRPMGRTAQGVRGIRLEKDDIVIGMEIVQEGGTLLTVCENGYGKRTEISEYRIQSRGGKGVINIKTDERNGMVVGIKEVIDSDKMMLITSKGMVIQCPISEIRSISRNTKGVRLIRLEEGDKVAAVARLGEKENENGEPEPAAAKL
ncbi:MAG: DNA gyrase subunit A [bacterium]|nr:DNA gyrase subunit A [bacterium]